MTMATAEVAAGTAVITAVDITAVDITVAVITAVVITAVVTTAVVTTAADATKETAGQQRNSRHHRDFKRSSQKVLQIVSHKQFKRPPASGGLLFF